MAASSRRPDLYKLAMVAAAVVLVLYTGTVLPIIVDCCIWMECPMAISPSHAHEECAGAMVPTHKAQASLVHFDWTTPEEQVALLLPAFTFVFQSEVAVQYSADLSNPTPPPENL
jgi:hypothetical protein